MISTLINNDSHYRTGDHELVLEYVLYFLYIRLSVQRASDMCFMGHDSQVRKNSNNSVLFCVPYRQVVTIRIVIECIKTRTKVTRIRQGVNKIKRKSNKGSCGNTKCVKNHISYAFRRGIIVKL